ncbi:MAG: sodium/proline symporter, partial [Myxococcota bacterium]
MLVGTMIAYFLLVLAIGVRAQRHASAESDFMLGGRRTGPWVAAVGAAASSSSAWTLLGVSGAAYAWGLSALWLFPACVGGFCLNWFVMAPALRAFGHEHQGVSVPDILSRQADGHAHPLTRIYAAGLILLSMGAYVAAQYQGAGKTFSTVFEISAELAIVLGALCVFAYTMLGGFLAVSLTDTLQGFVMALTSLLLPALALWHVGGVSELMATLREVTDGGYLTLSGPRTPILGIGFAAGLLGIGLGYPGQPHVIKYFLAMDSHPNSVSRARTIA